MKILLRAVVSGFGFGLGAGLYKRISRKLGLGEPEGEAKSDNAAKASECADAEDGESAERSKR